MIIPRTIYAIQHNVTKKIYIGSTKDVKKRYFSHIYNLRAGQHAIEDMQDDFIEYGEDYSVYELETITDFADRGKEYDWMRKYSTHIRGIGYNYKDKAAKPKPKELQFSIKKGLPEVCRVPETYKEYRAKIDEMLSELEEPQLYYIYKYISGYFGFDEESES